MPGDHPFLDQLARLATDAADAAESLRKEIEAFVKARMEKLAAEMNFVPRDEFDAVKAMAAKALAENEALKERLEELERRIST